MFAPSPPLSKGMYVCGLQFGDFARLFITLDSRERMIFVGMPRKYCNATEKETRRMPMSFKIRPLRVLASSIAFAIFSPMLCSHSIGRQTPQSNLVELLGLSFALCFVFWHSLPFCSTIVTFQGGIVPEISSFCASYIYIFLLSRPEDQTLTASADCKSISFWLISPEIMLVFSLFSAFCTSFSSENETLSLLDTETHAWQIWHQQ